MLGDLRSIEKSIEEILIDLMAEKFMFVGLHASSIGRLKESPLTVRQFVPSRTKTEKRGKHRHDLVNAKKISSVFPNYIPPFDGTISCDNIQRDLEYTLIIAYHPKGIRAVRP
jgi:hypothetical protein